MIQLECDVIDHRELGDSVQNRRLGATVLRMDGWTEAMLLIAQATSQEGKWRSDFMGIPDAESEVQL